MNRKLIVDHPLRDEVKDLEAINFLEKVDKKAAGPTTEPTTKPADPKPTKETAETKASPEKAQHVQKQKFHHLQVLDEDAEAFKTKLENMLNNFKMETFNEFLSTKRALLEEQRETIENETRKFTRVLESRSNELDKTKEALALKVKDSEKTDVVIHALAGWSGTARMKRNNVLLLSKYFGALKLHRKLKEERMKLKKSALRQYKLKMCGRFLALWKEFHVDTRISNLNKTHDDTMTKELNELAAKYNKEIDMLTKRLQETQRSLDEANRSTFDMQENLKKAFMRGVCALNFEAMNIIQHKEQGEGQDMTTHLDSVANQMFNFARTTQSFGTGPSLENTQQMDQRDQRDSEPSTSSPQKNIVFYQNPKLESKELKWKDAPIVGTSTSFTKEKIGGLSNLMRQSENKENSNTQPDSPKFKDEFAKGSPQRNSAAGIIDDEEGRVIKVNKGKSYAVGEVASKSVKDEKPAITVAGNKTSQLRAQLAAKKK